MHARSHENYTLSLHDALPISSAACARATRSESGRGLPHSKTLRRFGRFMELEHLKQRTNAWPSFCARLRDRKSTRLNSSHLGISYAVFCLKKKKLTAGIRLPS